MTATSVERPAERAAAPEGSRSSRASRALRPLARAEGRRLLRHPAFVVGILLTLFLLQTIGGSYGWRVDSIGIVLYLVPLGWLTLVAANLGALRARRHGAEELFSTLPTSTSTRTTAHVLAQLAAAPVAIALLIVWVVLHTIAFTPFGAGPDLAEIATAVPIVVGGGVVGVAVARWLPRALFAVPAIFVTAFIATSFTNSVAAPTRWLGFYADAGITGLAALDPRPAEWHLVWLSAWVAIMGVVAVGRHGFGGNVALAGVVAVLVASVAGWMQTRSASPAEIKEMASLLMEPTRHQECVVHSGITYCAYGGYEAVRDEWRATVEGVVAAIPADARRPLEVRQRVATYVGDPDCQPAAFVDSVPGQLAARLDPETVWAADGQVHPPVGLREAAPCSDVDMRWLYTAIQTGAWAVGLPPAPSSLDRRCSASHQARAAVALWLGSQAVDGGQEKLVKVVRAAPFDRHGRVDFHDVDSEIRMPWNEHPQWGVRYHAADIDAAIALLERPAPEVRRLVADRWAEITHPSTSTAELLEWAGAPDAAARTPSGDCPVLGS